MKCWLGIDPGKTGAVGIIWEDGLIGFLDWQEGEDAILRQLATIKEQAYRILTVLEDVHPMPKEGVSSSFSFGLNVGWWRGVLDTLKIPYIRVSPAKWQKAVLDSPRCKVDVKRQVLEFACRRWPEVQFRGPRGGAKTGRADAFCMAEYARRQEP